MNEASTDVRDDTELKRGTSQEPTSAENQNQVAIVAPDDDIGPQIVELNYDCSAKVSD